MVLSFFWVGGHWRCCSGPCLPCVRRLELLSIGNSVHAVVMRRRAFVTVVTVVTVGRYIRRPRSGWTLSSKPSKPSKPRTSSLDKSCILLSLLTLLSCSSRSTPSLPPAWVVSVIAGVLSPLTLLSRLLSWYLGRYLTVNGFLGYVWGS